MNRHFIKQLLPPLLLDGYRRLRGGGIRFRGEYPDWPTAARHAEGYAQQDILERVRRATQAVRRGEAACERDGVPFQTVPYPFPLIATLLRAAQENSGRLTVLDFGGSLGSSYYQCRDFLSGVAALRWLVVEQPHFVACGRREFRDAVLDFFPDPAAAAALAPPDVILVSGVLQYLEDYRAALACLTNLGAAYIVIDRTPVALDGREHISVQQIPRSLGGASYPIRLFAEGGVRAILLQDYRQLAEFATVDSLIMSGNLSVAFKGWIFARSSQSTACQLC